MTFDWLTSRRGLLARRSSPLPVGAICMEGGPVTVSETGELELDDVTSLGTFTLHADHLEFFAISQERMEAAVALVARRLDGIVGAPARDVRPVQDALQERRAERAAARAQPRSAPGRMTRGGRGRSQPDEMLLPPDARIRELSYRRWIDDPNQHLGGLSPRQAAAGHEHREELEIQLRSIEHCSARERADRRPGPEVSWLRGELSVGGARLAA